MVNRTDNMMAMRASESMWNGNTPNCHALI